MMFGSPSNDKMPTIDLGGDEFPVIIREHPRARAMKLRYDSITGAVRITVPKGTSRRVALGLANDHHGWLQSQIAKAVAPVTLRNGATLALEGHERIVAWSRDAGRTPVLDGGTIRVGGEEASVERRLLGWLKSKARSQFAEDLAYYCGKAGKSVPPLAIGDPRTRWGSCSTRSGIRLNWRLIMAPPSVRRSVVAHEVAHLSHMDHSKDFYDHLDRLFEGDRRAADHWLRSYGNGLRAIGTAR